MTAVKIGFDIPSKNHTSSLFGCMVIFGCSVLYSFLFIQPYGQKFGCPVFYFFSLPDSALKTSPLIIELVR